jgi:3-deoxy-D-manno-octulosonate 8-phosphate phosphatase (KDO 8-P phosphatase)
VSGQPTLAERCRRIELLVLDVDGVLTDGGIVYSDSGAEVKQFHVRDGSGLKVWQLAGKRSAVITGRTSKIVEVRAAEIGIGWVFQGAADKLPVYRELLARAGVTPDQVCYVGDDVPDLPLLANCGLAVPSRTPVRKPRAVAHHITPGGGRAVREVTELILRCQGPWQRVVARYQDVRLSDA